MARRDIDLILGRITALSIEINAFVPADTKTLQFRADLAGLLVVAIAATYESCVKETLVNYSSRHHEQFGNFSARNYRKLNSRISLGDLYKYAGTFDDKVHYKFGQLIKTSKAKLNARVGKDFTEAYQQLLSWRHDFAHAGVRNTTVEEALATHTLAKRVIYAFDAAFEP